MIESTILKQAERFTFWILLLVSLYMLIRGHNHPGGGFIGGLIGASAFVVASMAQGVEGAAKRMPLSPHNMFIWGLLIGVASTLFGPLSGGSLMQGTWLHWGDLHLGSPLVFDIGVYMTVIGIVTQMVFSLMSEANWKSS